MGGFLAEPAHDDKVGQLYADDLASDGYIMNLTRVWAWCPDALEALAGVLGIASRQADIDVADRAVLTLAAAATIGDSYCSMAYGLKSSDASGEPVAMNILERREDNLTARQEALARWARKVAAAPNDIAQADVDELRS